MNSGFSRYHWVGLLVPLLAAISPMWISRLPKFGVPQPIFAVLAGFLVAGVSFLMLRFLPLIKEPLAFGKSVLLGALATEVLIFHGSTKMPPMTTITLYLFFYFNTIEFLNTKSH